MRILLIAIIALLPASAPAMTTDSAAGVLEELVALLPEADPRDGVATYYASRFEGRRTTSGERYNPYMMTAAHATLPIGSVVAVEHPETARTVIVRINDRCHSRHATRNLIDLSRIAAMQIGVWGRGMTRVMIRELKGWQSEDDSLLQELVD